MLERFWIWYQKHYKLNLTVASFLFGLQLFHLYWLFTDVMLFKLTGTGYFLLSEIWGVFSTLIDYTEVPAIITTSLVYIHLLRQKFSYKNFWYLIFLNIQWLHLFWITDEIVAETFTEHELFHWAAWLAWIAIIIDFLELPVIYDTAKKLFLEIKKG